VHDPLANLAVHMYIQEYTNFPRMKKPSQNSRRQKVDMKQVPYWALTNIRGYRAKSRRPGDLALGISTSL